MEFHQEDRTYLVVISTRTDLNNVHAGLLVRYAPGSGDVTTTPPANNYLCYRDVVFPIYGDLRTFDDVAPVLVRVQGSAAAVTMEEAHSGSKVLHVGYNIFQEARFLLSSGQPACNALMPTLEIHISMLRDWILDAGVPLVEIPAAPAGHEFIACLTHDVDFVRIADHKLDHTMWGFVYRASIGSFFNLVKQRISFRSFLKNLKALVSLPAIHLGLCKDFWREDFDRFVSLERDLKATFFFIPFKGRPGEKVQRRHPERRVAAYDVTQETALLRELTDSGNEIGVHGIDAWHDAEKGRAERRRLDAATTKAGPGIRVHWLCFDADSPRVLEKAGFEYDSTIGYNETVGYRAGTAQVFRPDGAETLLELPLHIQDGALFYKGYLGLADAGAWKFCETIVKNAGTYGGAVTILWHTRSLAPERQWGDFYQRLLQALRERPVWFATAGQAVEWFRHRRAVSFREVEFSGREARVFMEGEGRLNPPGNTPDLVLRVHSPRPTANAAGERSFVDVPWTGQPVMNISIG